MAKQSRQEDAMGPFIDYELVSTHNSVLSDDESKTLMASAALIMPCTLPVSQILAGSIQAA